MKKDLNNLHNNKPTAMNQRDSINILASIFEKTFKKKPLSVNNLPRSGSERSYFRLANGNVTAMGVHNLNVKENEAFFSFTDTFERIGIKAPKILAVSEDRKHYLVTDLGNESLADRIKRNRFTEYSEEERSPLCVLKKTIIQLKTMQLEGARKIDFSKCYPREAFDRQSVMWDLNYFKYNFLKLAGIPFDEQVLEDDFARLAEFLLEAPTGYFMYRDFQPGNIMVIDNEPWFIDYQGGRKGPLQYDIASLLYSPKTALNPTRREVLLEFYINLIKQEKSVNTESFSTYFYAFALIRILQALGAYGYRGIFEGKPNFQSSIPIALSNLNEIIDKKGIGIELPEIEKVSMACSQSALLKTYDIPSDKLTIRVSSFSYKKGIPADPSGNGGGFVFDCRGLPNPGRMEEFKQLTGKDKKVTDYLEQFPDVKQFQEKARNLIEISINNYLERGFNHLAVSFGCTGGQHRSVFQAEDMGEWLKKKFPVNVILVHTEEENWNT
ncbi:MAG: phosphotransferase [Prolixibacteraceae bacterium]|nr:phosphotransferase [Prolixibacteraceae bacterium]